MANRVNRAHWPTKENRQKYDVFLSLVWCMEKIGWNGPKWGQEDFSPTNQDLADILGRTDLDLENSYFLICFGIPNSQISRSPDFQISRNLGQAWAGLAGWAPRVGPRVVYFLILLLTFLGFVGNFWILGSSWYWNSHNTMLWTCGWYWKHILDPCQLYP